MTTRDGVGTNFYRKGLATSSGVFSDNQPNMIFHTKLVSSDICSTMHKTNILPAIFENRSSIVYAMMFQYRSTHNFFRLKIYASIYCFDHLCLFLFRGPQELLQINWCWSMLLDADCCWLMLIELIDTDCCWLLLIIADWCWLMLLKAVWCWLMLK